MISGISLTKKFEKIKILVCRKWSKIECQSSLGPKEDVKNHFHSFHGDFRPKQFFEKKSSKIFSKIAKNTIFLKFELWVFGRKWSIFGRKASRLSRVFPKFWSKFF